MSFNAARGLAVLTGFVLLACGEADAPTPPPGGTAGSNAVAGQSTAGQGPAGTAGTLSAGADTGGSGGAASSMSGSAGMSAQGGSASGGSDSAGTGGGAVAGSGGAPPGVDCPAGSFVCEGFEAYASDAAPTGIWTKTERAGGSVKVDEARHASGTKAVHFTGTINGDVAHITTPVTITGDTVFVRFMMYTVGYPSSAGVHSRLARIGTTKDSGPDSSYSLSSYNGTAIEKVDSIYLRSVNTKLNDDALKNRWLCVEFEIDKTGGVGKVVPHIWLDGAALTLAAAGSTTHAGTSASWDPIPYEIFTLGLEGNQADAVSGNYWIDDLVIAPARIGCKAP